MITLNECLVWREIENAVQSDNDGGMVDVERRRS